MVEKATLDKMTQERLAGLANALRVVQFELGLPQLLSLLAIAAEPGLSVNELAERVGLPQQTASRHVATLAGRYQGAFEPIAGDGQTRLKLDPLITQEISQSDPRSRALFISRQGRALLDAMAERLAPVVETSHSKMGGTT